MLETQMLYEAGVCSSRVRDETGSMSLVNTHALIGFSPSRFNIRFVVPGEIRFRPYQNVFFYSNG